MADLSQIEASQSVKIAGGNEENWVSVTDIKELSTSDVLNEGGLDSVLFVESVTPEELKVGANRKADRKYVIFIPLDSGLSFGFSSSSQSFPCFKNQLIMMPVGDMTEIWFSCLSGTKTVAIGEL